MPLFSYDLAHDLHAINCRLRFWLDSLVPVSASAAGQPQTATPEQMNGLLSQLMQAGAYLRSMPLDRDVALEEEITEYRNQVERLRALLPSIHETLLREKARLEEARSRLALAGHWARLSGQTL